MPLPSDLHLIVLAAIRIADLGLPLHNLPVSVGQEAVRLEHAHGSHLGLPHSAHGRGHGQSAGVGDVAHAQGFQEVLDGRGIHQQSEDHDPCCVE